MKIENDCIVTLSVTMSDLQNNELEKSDELVYLHGHNDIFPEIEKALQGKNVGEKVHVELEPHEAFGDYDDMALMIVDETDFTEGVEVGLLYTTLRGQTLDRPYRVTDIAAGKVVLDGNHPLAGYGLKFDITVKNVEKPAKGAEEVGTDDVVVPSFLSISNKPVDVFDDEERAQDNAKNN